MKRIALIMLLIILLTAVLIILPVNGETEIYEKIIRLHVIAASDSEEDQALKLKVRDAILEYTTGVLAGCNDRTEAEKILADNVDEMRCISIETLAEYACDYPVTVEIGPEDYPTREYDGLKLPAGEYCSLRISIGEAQGNNWWCILFPPLCTSAAAASEELVAAGFTANQIRILTETENPKYVLRFKILEIIGEIFD